MEKRIGEVLRERGIGRWGSSRERGNGRGRERGREGMRERERERMRENNKRREREREGVRRETVGKKANKGVCLCVSRESKQEKPHHCV